MNLAFGSDHAGYLYRRALAEYALQRGHEVIEVGAPNERSYDYPDAADALVRMILDGSRELGVLVCGSGIGVSIRANRYPGIRAAACCSTAVARIARSHNHANVLCLGQRFLDLRVAKEMLDAFIDTETDQEQRHVRRIQKLDDSVQL